MNDRSTADMETLRQTSIAKLKSLGFSPNEHLPLSDWPSTSRTKTEIVRRCELLCLCIAKAHQVPMDHIDWAREHGLVDELHERELSFLTQANAIYEETVFFRAQEEALWVLCWAIGLVKEIHLNKPCDQSLARTSPGPFRAHPLTESDLAQRPVAEVVQLDDSLYVLDNLLVGQRLHGEPPEQALPHYVVRYRRYATQWLLSDEDYYDRSFDT
jgi:hypothetical protein